MKTRCRETPCILVAARLYHYRVVALVETAVLDEDVFRHLDVNAVVVAPVSIDIKPPRNDSVAKIEVNCPKRRLAYLESLKPHIPAAVELDEMRPDIRLRQLR